MANSFRCCQSWRRLLRMWTRRHRIYANININIMSAAIGSSYMRPFVANLLADIKNVCVSWNCGVAAVERWEVFERRDAIIWRFTHYVTVSLKNDARAYECFIYVLWREREKATSNSRGNKTWTHFFYILLVDCYIPKISPTLNSLTRLYIVNLHIILCELRTKFQPNFFGFHTRLYAHVKCITIWNFLILHIYKRLKNMPAFKRL